MLFFCVSLFLLSFFGWKVSPFAPCHPNLHMPNKVVIDPLLSPSVVVLAWWHELLTLYPPRASNWYRRQSATLCSLGFCLETSRFWWGFLRFLTSTSIHQTYHWGAKTQQNPPRWTTTLRRPASLMWARRLPDNWNFTEFLQHYHLK